MKIQSQYLSFVWWQEGSFTAERTYNFTVCIFENLYNLSVYKMDVTYIGLLVLH